MNKISVQSVVALMKKQKVKTRTYKADIPDGAVAVMLNKNPSAPEIDSVRALISSRNDWSIQREVKSFFGSHIFVLIETKGERP